MAARSVMADKVAVVCVAGEVRLGDYAVGHMKRDLYISLLIR